MKANYTSPEMEILQFSREDIITTSTMNNSDPNKYEIPIVGGGVSETDDSLS